MAQKGLSSLKTEEKTAKVRPWQQRRGGLRQRESERRVFCELICHFGGDA